MKRALGAAAGLGSWLVRNAVLLAVCRDFQRRRQELATTAHRALPVPEWPALGIPWATARSNEDSEVCSRSGGFCTVCCGRAGQVICEGCGFAGSWRFVAAEEAALGNHSAQSPASV